jgi:hypothetical integral membrane protein (TIGR02206 family)
VPSADFSLFGGAHLGALGLLLFASLLLTRVPRTTSVTRLAQTFAVLLLAQEAVKVYMFIGVYDQPWAKSLPLAFCRINEFVCAYMLLARSYRAFEVAYFWAITGSVIALLTPDLRFGFPDPRFVSFFFGHSLAVLAVLYAILGYGFRPRLRSVGLAMVVTASYTLLVAGINLVLDTNYLFLRAKPQGASIMDYFGPWPIYIAGNVVLTIALFILAYLPFAHAAWDSRSADS